MTSKQETKTPMKNGSVIEKRDSTLNLVLHPLVIINISDHWTRTRAQNHIENPRVIGALLGMQTGRNVEIFNSFELVYDVVNGKVQIDGKYLAKKSEQFKKVFPLYDFLGWYSSGDAVHPSDMDIHRSPEITESNESPLYLLLDPVAARKQSKELPIAIYESELHMIDANPTNLFVKVPYKVETGEAERIAVDHVAKISPSGGQGEGSLLSAHMLGVYNAITMLSMRNKVLLSFLEATKNGKIPKDQGILRRIASLCNQLPAIDTEQFKHDFINEYNDALLITYLATITKGTNATNELIEKFNATYEKHGRRRPVF